MAFKDITKVLYNGSVKLDYKDKAHRYYVRERINWDLSEDDAKAWSKIIYPKGTTTLLGDTLEKKGLMTWPLGLAIRELFGFYDFKTNEGNQMTGFSKGVGTMWEDGKVKSLTQEELLPIVSSANKAWQRKQQKGADIGSVVHDAIEHYVLGHTNNPEIPSIEAVFDIAEHYMWSIKEAVTDIDSPEYQRAMEEFESDVECANKAFAQFKLWWDTESPKLLGAEQIVYSEEYNFAGSFDGLIELDGKIILCDWKTSSASKSKEAASPNGVYYSYFIQSAMYALALLEMGDIERVDDLMIVSCRKDGGFNTLTTADIGLTVEECLKWAKCVISCYKYMDIAKKGLLAYGEKNG